MTNLDENLLYGKMKQLDREHVSSQIILKNSIIPLEEWDVKGIVGATATSFFHPHFYKFREHVLNTFTPKHKIAVFSLCSNTRPYSVSQVWGEMLKRNLDAYADLFILSNPGVIPLLYTYELCYPILHYDWPPQEETHELMRGLLYTEIHAERIRAFLTKFPYKIILSYFPECESRDALWLALHTLPGLAKDGLQVMKLPSPRVWGESLESNPEWTFASFDVIRTKKCLDELEYAVITLAK